MAEWAIPGIDILATAYSAYESSSGTVEYMNAHENDCESLP